MADDIRSDIIINVDTSVGIAEIKNLQRQISQLNAQLLQSGAQQAKAAQNIQRNLINNINATGKFAANVRTVSSTAESFTTALERNKLGMGEYFRYAGGASKTFGKLFKKEFDTIDEVAKSRVRTLQTQFIKLGRDANGALKAISVRPLALDMDNLATKTAIAAQKQQLFNQLLKQGSTNLLNFGKNTQWAGRQLMVGFSVPLAYLGSIAAKTFMKMEEQAIRFKRVYGELFTTQEETDQMVKDIQRLANEFTKYGVAVEKTMGMAADAAAMGKMGIDLIAQVNQATRLAVLGGVEQAEALETTISVTNAFGVAAEKLAGKIDFLNAVENQTVTSIEDLTIAIPKAGPVIQQLGGDVEDLAFFLTAMKEGGINASEGANALKSGLASMINPTEKVSKMLAQFGINIKGIVDANAGDVKNTVIGLAQALDTLDPLNRARAIEQLFGKFQFSRISTLFQNVIAEGSQAQKVLDLAGATSEELAILSQRELKKIETSPMYKFKAAVEDLKASLIPLGEAFLKAITPVIEFAKGFLDRFNEMGDGAKNFAVLATTVVAGIGPVLLMTFGLIANGVANLIKMFTAIGKIFKGAGASSQDLANSTDYMTQQQLEAAAVASSLNQSHSKLIETFSVESSAVDSLAAAYRRATAAQQSLLPNVNMRGGSRGKPPMKLQSGILSVPGPKGAGDVVPAMLSPGEAVIPAKQSQKYAGLIQGMMTDKIPGFAVGRNPFAFMLKRSRVAVRTKQEDLLKMLQAGKDAKYSSAFTTGTGADYLTRSGLPNAAQKRLREQMEAKVFGLGANTPAAERPTYGYARTSATQAFINRIFGFRGRQFNAVSANKRIGNTQYWSPANDPNTKYQQLDRKDSLARYGDIDLITKRIVGKRSKAAVTDALIDFSRSGQYPSFNLRPASMSGKGSNDYGKAKFDRLSKPFGTYKTDPVNNPNAYSSNPKPPYIETYTPGGFKLSEVSRIVTRDRATAKALQKLVRQAGLKIKVTPQNAPLVVRMLSNLMGTRFEDGTTGAPSQAKALKSLTKVLRSAPGPLAREFQARIDYYNKIDPETKLPVNEVLRKENEFVTQLGRKYGLDEKVLGSLRGAHLSHIEKDYETRQAFGKTFQKKNWTYQNLQADHAMVNKALDDMSKTSSFKGIVDRVATNIDEVAKSLGINSQVARKEIERLRGGAHPTSVEAYKLLGRVAKDFYLANNGSTRAITATKEAGMLSDFIDERVRQYQASPAKSYLGQLASMRITPRDAADKAQLAQVNIKARQRHEDVIQNKTGIRTAKAPMPRLMAGKIRGFKRGVVSVPGPKGKGDVVPAMLSPGEAVIPSAMSKKYAPLINGMINDSIPGYAQGKKGYNFGGNYTGNAAPSVAPYTGLNFTPITQSLTKDLLTAVKTMDKKALKDAAKNLGTRVMSVAGAEIQKHAGKLGTAVTGAIATSVPASARFAVAMQKGFTKLFQTVGQKVEQKAAQVQARNAIRMTPMAGPTMANGRFSNNKAQERKYQRQQARAQQAQQRSQMKFSERYSNTVGKFTGAAGAAAGGAMMGAMMLSMGEGPMAKMAQDLMPVLMGLSVALPLMSSLWGSILVAIGSVVAAMMILNAQYDEAQKKAIDYANAMKASTKAMDIIAEFGGKVTASQIMDKRRSERDRELGAVSGKTTYGEAFVQTEAGKAQVTEIAKQLSGGNRSGSIADMTSQLSSAVLGGAMTFDQAKSMAANLAAEAGDASIGIEVIAKMEKILGPDGTDITKNPLQVRMNMLAENQKTMQQSLATAQNRSGFDKWLGTSGGRNTVVAGSALAAGASGAGIGAAIGSVIPGLGTAVGAVIGGVVGTIAGAVGGYFATEEATKQYGKLGAAAAVDAKIALEQNKALLDSMDLFYEKKIAELKIQGKINEAAALQKQYTDERAALTEAMAQTNEQILAGFNADPLLQESLTTGAKKAVEAKYKDDPDQIAYLDAVNAQKDQLGLGGDIKYLIDLKMASGEIAPATMRKLLAIAAGSEEAETAVISIMTKFSGDVAGRTAEIGQLLGDENLAADLTLKINAQTTDAEATDVLNNFSELTRINTVIPAKVAAEFYLENPEEYNKFNALIDTINDKKPKTIAAVLEIAPQLKGKISPEDEAYFNTLTDDQKMVYTKTLVSQLFVPEPEIIASADFQTWLGESQSIVMPDGKTYNYGGAQYAGLSANTQVAYYRAQEAFKASQSAAALAPQTPVGGGGGGGGTKEEPLDEPLQRLKEIRDSRINAKGGKKEIMRLLGGNRSITRFKGMEQELLRLGANSEFRDYLMGLDKAEQDKYFKINKKTGTLNLTDLGQATRKGFNEIALGDAQMSMKETTKGISDQNLALKRLVAGGLSVSEAYNAVEDTALAAALASKELTKTELDQLVKDIKAAEKATREYAAAQEIRKDIVEDNQNIRIEESFAKGDSKFNFVEQQAIMEDGTLKEIYGQYLAGEIENLPAEFGTRLQQVTNKIDFKEGLFDTAMEKSLEALSAKERKIELDMEVGLKNFSIPGLDAAFGKGARQIVQIAQNDIAKLQYKMDDFNAGLQEIEWQEDEINKAYDKKYEALEKIEKINSRITAQQQKQLTLADALSRGDIAAAAAAAQDMRAKSAEDAIASQKEALERAQQAQLDALKSKTGMTRKQIEEEILGVQKQIFQIEEQRLEPASEAIRIAEFNAGMQKEVINDARLQLDIKQNEVDLARTGSAEYIKAISEGLAMSSDIIKYYGQSPSDRASNIAAINTGDQGAVLGGLNNVVGPVPGATTTTTDGGPGGNNPGAKPTTDAGYGKTWTKKNGQWVAESVQKPTLYQQGKTWVWDNTGDKWKQEDYAGAAKYKPTMDPGAGNQWTYNPTTNRWAITKDNIPDGNTFDDAISAAALKNGSSESSPQTFTVGHKKWFKMPVGANIYSAKGNGGFGKPTTMWTIKYGKAPGLYTDGQGKTKEWWSTTFGKGAKGNIVQATDLLGFTEKPKDAHKQYPKWFPTDSIGFNVGGRVMGSDTVPAMLTPGEFVIRKYAVQNFGTDRLKAINNGTYNGESVYNYEVNVNVKSDANPDQIAKAVMTQIKQIDSMRIRSNGL